MSGAPVRIHLYATVREAVGRSTIARTLPPGGLPAARLLEELRREYPELARILPLCRVARNGRYLAGPRDRLRPGDEIAIHPPFSGG